MSDSLAEAPEIMTTVDHHTRTLMGVASPLRSRKPLYGVRGEHAKNALVVMLLVWGGVGPMGFLTRLKGILSQRSQFENYY